MLTKAIDQMRARRLGKIANAAAYKGKIRALQFRQVETERNLSLEPRFYSVPVG